MLRSRSHSPADLRELAPVQGVRRVPAAQLLALVEFLEGHVLLARGGFGSTTFKQDNSRVQWAQAARVVNAIPGGVYKSQKQWSQFWSCYKNKLKQRLQKVRHSVSGTGGGPSTVRQLSEFEQRVLVLLGSGFATSILGVRVEPEVTEEMARTKVLKRKKGGHLAENMLRAIQMYRTGMSLRKAAKECEVKYPTLYRYAKKNARIGDDALSNQRLTPKYDVNRIFTAEQELELKKYIKDCASKFYGLSSKDVRSVAFQMAHINEIRYPDSWESDKKAGVEWFRSFRQRHPDLTLKKPEACSLARATAFNRQTVSIFFSNLKNAMDRHPTFGNGCRVYNLDETATTTVQKPKKVVAPKGRHNLGQITSGERGTLVTTCAIVCASGQALPPVLVFPRKNYQDHMLTGAPPGSLGLAVPNGWMNAKLFVEVMKHFIKHTCASPENPALLIMDNHESHLSIEAIDLAKNTGVCLLTLHPHTTAKMQPLEVGLNGPFKTYYNAAVESWLRRNPGKPMKIYNVAECVGQAYPKAMTPLNIAAAFKKCGIFPFNEDIFEDIDFMPSEVTDREQPGTSSGLLTLASPVITDTDREQRGPSPGTVTITIAANSNCEQPGPSWRSSTTAAKANTNWDQPGPSSRSSTTVAKSTTNGEERPPTELHTSAFSDHLHHELICPGSPSSDVTYVESPQSSRAGSPSPSQGGIFSPSQAESPSIMETDRLFGESLLQDACFPSQDLNLLTTRDITPPSATEERVKSPNLVAPREMTPPSDTLGATSSSSGTLAKFKSPKDFMPPLKAGPRTEGRKPRKLGKSMIATDTPEKNEIAEERQKAKARKSVATKTKRTVLRDKKQEKKAPKKTKVHVKPSDEETSEEDVDMVLCQSETEFSDLDEEDENFKENLPLVKDNFKGINRKPKEGDYVLVAFETKKLQICYVALITETINANKFIVSYMRLKDKIEMKYSMPMEPDFSEIGLTDIKMILPQPKVTGSKNRNSFYIFPVRLSPKVNLR